MDLQEKYYLCETNQAFCNIYGKILCQSMSCAWQRKFHKKTEKRQLACHPPVRGPEDPLADTLAGPEKEERPDEV